MIRDLKVLIIDDDSGARSILKKYLEIGDKVEIVGVIDDTFSALDIMKQNMPDIIFLDINMPLENGLEFAKKIRNLNIDVQVVFTTAYRNYALKALHLKPLDYLVKPFGINEVFDILTRAHEIIAENKKNIDENKVWGKIIPEKLKFKTLKGYIFINYSDILYAKVMGSVVELFLCDGSKKRVITLFNSLCDELSPFDFSKVNRSLIINMRYFTSLNSKSKICIVKCNSEVYEFSVSQTFIKNFDKKHSLKIG